MSDALPANDPSSAAAPSSGDLPGRDPFLPPTDSLSPDEFEDFTERLLNAHKYAGPGVLRTVHVVRWGRRGDPQDGIDFAGELSDGNKASWQCKRYDTFSVAETREAIEKDTYGADMHHLVLSCEASTPVRREIDRRPNWRLLDKRGLQQLLEDLPRHKRRDVLDATFGAEVRRRLMASPGQDLVISLQAFAKDRLDPSTILNDQGTFTGRQHELEGLRTAVTPTDGSPRVVLVTGPGGRGKSRLLLEALSQVEAHALQRPVVLLAPGAPLSPQAIQELPGTAAVVVVDDAHQHPEALQALTNYLRQVPGTQVVLACRPSGSQAVHDALSDRLGPRDIHTVEVDQLAIREARQLVDALAEGLGLPWTYRDRLAREAMDSPHVAVIAINLIRRGEMTRAPVVDPHLRQHVLSRYRDVAAGMVSGIDVDQVSALLAVYAALRGVRDDDERADEHIRALTGLNQRQLLHARMTLRDRGVLVTRQGQTTVVVPEVLGDQALEDQAAIDGRDTGFATEVWERFGPSEGPLLLGSLAELEWRLKQREGGGPEVLTAVWADLRDRLLHDDLDEVRHYLQSLDRLTFTHPKRFLDLLEELRARLISPESRSSSVNEGDQARRPPSAAQLRRRLFAFTPAGPADVLKMLAPLYGRCAHNGPELLEQALAALWALRRLPQQLPDTRQEHPQRVVADMLADLGQLPDLSFPMRIVAAVESGLHAAEETPQGADWVSPLFMLRPLLVKQTTFSEQSDRRTMQMSSRFISPTWATSFRECIRKILQQQAASDDARRAGEAVALLHQMLLPLHPSLGSTITAEQDAAWGEDELATVLCLARAAEETTSGAVRRHIRHEVAWSAQHARSLPARQQALELVTVLDQRAEDDLVEALMPLGLHGTAHRRGLSAPTLAELTAERAARAARRKQLTEEELAAEDEARVDGAHERHCEEGRAVQSRAIRLLTAQGTAPSMIATLDAAARDVTAVAAAGGGHMHTSALYASLADANPDLLPGLLQSLAAGDDGPLDRDVHRLVESWRQRDSDAALTWLRSTPSMRAGLCRAIARGWVLHPWLEAGPAFRALFDVGIADADAEVRETHLLASFRRYPDEPGQAIRLLLDADASAPVCQRALQNAVPGEPAQWGAGLSHSEAEFVLQLVDRAGWQDWTAQQVASGVAASHPVLLLDYLAGLETVIGHEVDPRSLPVALEANADQTGSWLLDRCLKLTPSQLQHVADAAFPEGLGAGVAASLERGMINSDAPRLLALADCLQYVSIWPARRPELTRTMLRRARQLAPSTVVDLLAYLSIALRINTYSFTNGVSEELQTAYDLCDQLIDAEADASLREVFTNSRDRLASHMASVLRDDDEE